MVGLVCGPGHYGRDYLPAIAVRIRHPKTLLMVFLTLGLLDACSSRSPAPIHDRPANADAYKRKTISATPAKRPFDYIVRKGDTLYSIAWRFGLDHKTLATWNGVGPPFTIFPGQELRLSDPSSSRSGSSVASEQSSPSVEAKPKAKSTSSAKKMPPARQPPPPRSTVSASELKWSWPAKGRVVKSFAANDPGAKGLDIEGQLGQEIIAAAPGEVVYSGVGLIGYGELIIIKHDQQLLSAYGHNRRRLVKEGDRVQAGQRIAEMGKTGTDQPLLHFEIRKDGQPVDPKRYLP